MLDDLRHFERPGFQLFTAEEAGSLLLILLFVVLFLEFLGVL